MGDRVLTQQNGIVFEIILNRPEKRNAISWNMLEAVAEAIDVAEQTPGIRAVVFRGNGNGFSAGIDLEGFEELAEAFGENWRKHLFPVTEAMQAALNKVENCTLPTIALLHNYCIGIGLELALACDFRIVTAGTKLSLPEVTLGLIPDVGGTTRLTRLVGFGRAKEMIMTGRGIYPDRAYEWGLVTEIVEKEDELYDTGYGFAQNFLTTAPLAVSYAKKVINGVVELDAGLKMEAWAQNILINTEDFDSGVQGALTRRPVPFKGK